MYSILSAFKMACPCYQAGFVAKSKTELSKPKKHKCPLNQFTIETEACIFCKFSYLYNHVLRAYKKRLYVFLYLQDELNKLIIIKELI